jgi:hypothetical protein
MADQPGGICVAGQETGIEDHVGDVAAGAPAPVRAVRHQGAAAVADGALADASPRFQGRAAARARQETAVQRTARRAGVEDLDHRSSRQAGPGPHAGEGGTWCCSLAAEPRSRNRGRPQADGPAPGGCPCRRTRTRSQVTAIRDSNRRGAANGEAALPTSLIATVRAVNKELGGNPPRRSTPEQTPNTDIREFRSGLRACTEGTVSPGGTGDDQYSEQKFLQVKRIIELLRPGGPGRG